MSTQNRRAVGLRRSVLEGKSRRRTGKGGWRGTWQDRLDIPKAEETDILLTRAEYPNPEDLAAVQKGQAGRPMGTPLKASDIAWRSDSSGDVPGLLSVDTAIATPCARNAAIGGCFVSRRQ